MIVASLVSVVVLIPAVLTKKARIETALVVSSAPWSMTLSTSSGPRIEAVTWTPPVPQPYGIGISRDAIARNGNRVQDRAADHALGLLVEIGEVLGARGHSAASAPAPPSRRSWRSRASSAWKST